MKNNKGFTLVETLAVIVLLSVILSIAIPSISGVIARNNRNRYKEAAEMFGVLARQRIEKDITIEYPSIERDDYTEVIMFLDEQYIDVKSLKNIYDIEYSKFNSLETYENTKSYSKAVFNFNSGKWNLRYLVLYDKGGKAAYLENGDYVVGDSNSNINLDDDYVCDEGSTEKLKKGYCYVSCDDESLTEGEKCNG